MKEQEVFFGDIPLMSQNGTFIVNGTERVIVSQLHRSPGVFFETANNRTYFLGKIIPYRGSWVEFEYDQKNTLYVRIDRKRKFLGTIFLRALGLRTDEEILKTFYTVDTINVADGKLSWKVAAEGQATQPAGHASGARHHGQGRGARPCDAQDLRRTRSSCCASTRSSRSRSRPVGVRRRHDSPPTWSTSPPASCSTRPTRS